MASSVNAHPQFINLKNGMLRVSDGQLLKHDPSYLSTTQVPIDWDPNAPTDAVDKFIGEVLPNDAINMFWEYVGSCFLTTQYLPKQFLLLIGPSNSGKSKVLELVGRLLGAENTSAVTFQALADNRFAVANLFGKLANIYADLPGLEARDAGLIKGLTGDDWKLMAERKNVQDLLEFRNTARLFFSANDYPTVQDADEAYWNRVRIIPCTNVFAGDARDAQVIQKVATPENMSGALLRAVQGYIRLARQGWELSYSETVHAAGIDYRSMVDTIAAFVESMMEEAPDTVETKENIYFNYREWCKEHGRQPYGSTRFYRKMKDVAPRYGMTEVNARHNGRVVQGYRGRKLGSNVLLSAYSRN